MEELLLHIESVSYIHSIGYKSHQIKAAYSLRDKGPFKETSQDFSASFS